ncbi:polysaccharide biosynthesis protein [Gordonia sp. NB41Y]|uniref:polysaccharide biosynthesis protein n=1 Tax=Gordonia sp. NB41Y TaxID=875808 RepID=UPI0006B21BB6|nr:polysaccharide biosynthesis protein [Gordonia sp. NB41Y]KOY49633.1 polysaccharide biosynthesis protein [Gordonia sp. NB41Y]WLP92384.1 polysaccharide biosynthesis protein [Gordonia sp. NB41Y]
MADPTPSPTGPEPTGSGSPPGALGRVTVATAIAAVSGYLVLLIAARALGPGGYAVFAVFWAAYGLVTGTQNGQLQETTRAIRAAGSPITGPTTTGPTTTSTGTGGRHPRARPLRVNLGIGVGLAVAVAVTAPLWSGAVFDAHRWLSVVLLACGVASFAVYAHLSGALSGTLSWGVFAVLLSVDALIRLAGAGLALALGWDTTAFLVITVIGSVSWMLLLLGSARARAVVNSPADVGTRTFTVQTLTAMAAAAASAVVVMGFPVLISLTSRAADDPDVVGAVILAITLTRAPLLVPLNSFQGVLISRFVAARHRLVASAALPLAAVTAIGVVGAGLAALVGPWLLRVVFGAGFRLDGTALALFTLGATALALLTITGAAALAVGAHRLYAIGWWCATVASVLLLLLPIAVTDRVALALICGPLIGIAVHLIALPRVPRHMDSQDLADGVA